MRQLIPTKYYIYNIYIYIYIYYCPEKCCEMYIGNGLYIYFTTPPPFRKRFFLPPRGLFSVYFLRKFGLFLSLLMVSCCSYTYVFVRCCGCLVLSCMYPCVSTSVSAAVFSVSYPLLAPLVVRCVFVSYRIVSYRIRSWCSYPYVFVSARIRIRIR